MSETLKIHREREKKTHAQQLAQVLVRVPSSGIDSLGASLGPPTELQSFSCLAYPIY